MTDYRKGNEEYYVNSGSPGVLRLFDRSHRTKDRPYFICHFCGGKTKQIRDSDGTFLDYRCQKIECQTLASMLGKSDWDVGPIFSDYA